MDQATALTVVLTALGIVGTCVGGLIWVIKYMFKSIIPTLNEINRSIKKNTRVTDANNRHLTGMNEREDKLTEGLANVINILQGRA